MTRARHRKPSPMGRNVAALATTGAFAVVPVALSSAPAFAADSAPAVNWEPIVSCESGGNPHAQNASSTASGLYQFLDSSWAAYGGSKYAGRAKDASAAQQTEIANVAFQRSGLSPWTASRDCWGGKVSTTSTRTTSARTLSGRTASATPTRSPRHASPTSHRSTPLTHRHSKPHRSTSTVHTGDIPSTITATRAMNSRARTLRAECPGAGVYPVIGVSRGSVSGFQRPASGH
jgi:hypothetical protein